MPRLPDPRPRQKAIYSAIASVYPLPPMEQVAEFSAVEVTSSLGDPARLELHLTLIVPEELHAPVRDAVVVALAELGESL